MSLTLEEIKAEAMRLPPEERADLADLLWVSVDLPEDVEAAWDAEIARRLDDFESARVTGISSAEVFAEVRALIENHGKL
ncbi:MAG: addiction module protein [Zoogloea sp.]|nr:addiction module protein [Zoogloea sp.]